MLLALDPSSTCTGYAFITGLEARDLVDAGRVLPNMNIKSLGHLSEIERAWLSRSELYPVRRVESMLPDVAELLTRAGLSCVAVETPSGRIGSGAKAGARGSLTTYGMAAGRFYQFVRDRAPAGVPVLAVTERMWTAGQGGKEKRALTIYALYAQYRAASEAGKDKGGDVADAIGIGRWAWRQLPQKCDSEGK